MNRVSRVNDVKPLSWDLFVWATFPFTGVESIRSTLVQQVAFPSSELFIFDGVHIFLPWCERNIHLLSELKKILTLFDCKIASCNQNGEYFVLNQVQYQPGPSSWEGEHSLQQTGVWFSQKFVAPVAIIIFFFLTYFLFSSLTSASSWARQGLLLRNVLVCRAYFFRLYMLL